MSYTVFIDTGNIVEAPPFVRAADNTPTFLGPGTKADVFFALVGDQGTSRRVTISGTTGKIAYDGKETGARAKTGSFYHRLMAELEPFKAGQEAVIPLSPEPPLDLGDLQSIIIGHNGAGQSPSWYLQKVRLVSASGEAVDFIVNAWLVGDQRQVRIAPDAISYVIPTGLTLSYADDQLLAQWQAVNGVTGYEFELRDADGAPVFTYPSAGTSATETDETGLEAIQDPFVEAGRFTTSNLRLDHQGHTIIMPQGGILPARLDINHYCPSCGGDTNQIIVGLGGEDRAQACLWNGGPSSDGWQTVSFSLNIPDQPGVYYIRTRYARAYNCQAALGWWKVDRPEGPTSDSNIGRVIVPESMPEQDNLTETWVTVPGDRLNTTTTYTARVRAVLGEVRSEWSDPVTFTLAQLVEIEPGIFDETYFDQARFDSASDWV